MKTLIKCILPKTLAFITSASGYVKKIHYPIEAVSGMADLIVVGEIENVNEHSYQFKVTETVKGKETEIIKVKMFKEWVCDRRMKEHYNGQRLLLFLNKSGWKYEIINGSTGEIFIEDNIVSRIINHTEPAEKELVKSLKSFTSADKLKQKDFKPFEKNVFIQLKTDNEISLLAKESKLTNWFFNQMTEYPIETTLN